VSRLAFSLLGVAAAALAVGGPTPALTQQPAKAAPAASPLAPAVTVVPAVEREVVERALVTGTLVPREEILVAPEVEGLRITEVLVEEGARVEAGQVLARLSRDLIEAQLAQAAATLAKAEASIAQAKSQIVQAEAGQTEAQLALERTRALMKGGNTTEAVLEARTAAARLAEGKLAAARDGLRIAEAEKAAAAAQRREIEVRLARTEIKAPAAGIVSRKVARVGASASPAGEALFRIIADGEIELEGEVTELQMPRLKPGAAAEVQIDPTRSLTGRVRLLYPEVDRSTRLGKVRIALPADPALRIGSFARGTVVVARRTGVAVPLSAVLFEADGAVVLAVVEGKVEARRVRTGLTAEGFVLIERGIAAGETVVVRAGSFLRHGDPVRPVIAEAASRNEGVR
jgi:HlyD family secretion protein